MNKLDRLEPYKLFRTNEIRENGSYTDINSLVNQSVADYEAGYTQAVTDQSDTLTQYKEALRELVKSIDDYTYYRSTSSIEEEQSDIRLSGALSKAKQLLTNK